MTKNHFTNTAVFNFTVFLAFAITSFSANANENEQTLLATEAAIREICKPVIEDGTDFRDAVKNSELPFGRVKSKGGIKSTSLNYGNQQNISVFQHKNNLMGCDISVQVSKKSDVKPTVQFVTGKWGCDSIEGARQEGQTLVYDCSQATVKLDIFANAAQTMLYFRFSPPPE